MGCAAPSGAGVTKSGLGSEGQAVPQPPLPLLVAQSLGGVNEAMV